MTDLINRAERFARVRHEGQFRKGKAQEPYTIHLEEVATLVERWSGSERAIAAAWLHDTVEDCPPTSVAELEALFGKEIAGIVHAIPFPSPHTFQHHNPPQNYFPEFDERISYAY